MGMTCQSCRGISAGVFCTFRAYCQIPWAQYRLKVPGGTQPCSVFRAVDYQLVIKCSVETRPKKGKRLRGYVLTCFQWFPAFVFQNPNESKMETKEMVISAQAAKLYERTWARFNQMLSIIPTMTLRSLCRDSRVNYCGMQEWMAQHGYAEPERADTGEGRASDPIGTSEENPTFLQLNPVSLPQSMAHDILRQVSITFSEGTVLTLQECSPEGVVSLLDTYARRRSAMEVTCLR